MLFTNPENSFSSIDAQIIFNFALYFLLTVKHLTVTIGPIYLGDLQSQELLSVLSMNRKFEIKFDYDEEDDDEETFGRPKSGYVL